MVDKKTKRKWNAELIDIHRKCITTYLSLKGVSIKYRRMFWKIYESEVNEDTINYYYTQPINIFIRALLRGELDEIKTNFKRCSKCRKRKKSKR